MPGSAYYDPPTFVPLQKLTAALQNAIGDSIRSLKWWSAGGSIPYSYDSDQLSELLKPAGPSLLFNDAAGVPSWIAKNAVGGLHAKGLQTFAPGGQTMTAWTDITGATLTLTLTAACTILVLAVVVGYQVTGGNSIYVRAVVDGGADANPKPFNGGEVRNESLPYIYYATGIASGARVVKMQAMGSGGTNASIDSGVLIALAFAE